MQTLADFLREQAEQEHAEAPERERKRADWLAAVERLLQQIETWLREADTVNVLHIERVPVELNEAGMGIYVAPGLVVRLRARRAQILPEGRNTFGQVLREDNG